MILTLTLTLTSTQTLTLGLALTEEAATIDYSDVRVDDAAALELAEALEKWLREAKP